MKLWRAHSQGARLSPDPMGAFSVAASLDFDADLTSQSPDRQAAPAGRAMPRANSVPSRRLDYLRGIAATYVVIGHARGHLFAGGSVLSETRPLDWLDYLQLALLQLTSLGTEAVILFFVLSGFAMAHSIRYTRSVKTFYLKRMIRIWPPYLLAVGLAFGFAYLILRSSVPNGVTQAVSSTGWGWADLLLMSFYSSVDSEMTAQFWSLPQEVIFYILCPLLLANISRVRVFWAISIVLTTFSMLSVGIYNDPTIGGGVIYQHFFTLLIYFMTGGMAYYYQHLIPRVSGVRLAIGTFFFLAIIWAVKYHVFHGWNQVTSLMIIPLSLMLLRNVPAKIYEYRPTNWGHFSYSIYIFHMQLIIMLSYLLARYTGIEQPEMTSYWLWALSVPPILLISWLLYFIGEKPCSDVLARWRDRDRQRVDAARQINQSERGA